MNTEIEKEIHLTDLSFIQVCFEKYGINRGIYNTIDSWFYEQGINNIIERRKNIIFFLEFISSRVEMKNCRKKFGNGGLKVTLEEFYETKGMSKTVSNF